MLPRPLLPAEVGFQASDGNVFDVVVRTTMLTWHRVGPGIVNVSNPAAPGEVGAYDWPNWTGV